MDAADMRWFGSRDAVTLADARQAGATGSGAVVGSRRLISDPWQSESSQGTGDAELLEA
jgi:D-mannonate dehydratase